MILDIDECESSPCQNGATCHNNQNHYACTCAGGWTGTNCDEGKFVFSTRNLNNSGDIFQKLFDRFNFQVRNVDQMNQHVFLV